MLEVTSELALTDKLMSIESRDVYCHLGPQEENWLDYQKDRAQCIFVVGSTLSITYGLAQFGILWEGLKRKNGSRVKWK